MPSPRNYILELCNLAAALSGKSVKCKFLITRTQKSNKFEFLLLLATITYLVPPLQKQNSKFGCGSGRNRTLNSASYYYFFDT